MVSSENGYAVTIAELEGYEESDGFNGIVATIDVVAHEQVICIGRVAADPEKF